MWLVAEGPEHQAVQDLNDLPDRAAAIVAASILEGALEGAIKTRLRDDDEDELKEMFGGSRPLGSFDAKIRLAFLLGLYGKEARGDLHRIRKVRNAFAHKLYAKSFGEGRIKDWCMALTIVDRHVFDSTAAPEHGGEPSEVNIQWFIPDRDAVLADPRKRFLHSIMFFTTSIREATNSPPHPPTTPRF